MDTFEYTANSLYSGGKIQRSKAGTDTAGTRKLKIFCIILLAILIIISGTMGALFYTLVSSFLRAQTFSLKAHFFLLYLCGKLLYSLSIDSPQSHSSHQRLILSK